MSILGRYLCRRIMFHGIILLIGMSALSLTFDLMEESDQVLTASGGDTSALLRYSLLRLPEILTQMLPIATLLGAFLTLNNMLRHSEMVAVWSGGISSMGVMRALLPVALLFAALQFALEDRAVPATLDKLYEWGVGNFQRSGFIHGDSDSVWLRSRRDIIRIPVEEARVGRLADVQIFRREADGLLSEELDVKNARRDGDAWLLDGVVRREVDPPKITTLKELKWDGRFDVEHLPLISRDLPDLTLTEISQLIDNEGYGQRPTDLYRTWYQYRIASATTPVLMIMLVVSLAQRFRRTGTFARLMIYSVAIGFSFFMFDGTSLALGEAGFVPPWISAWSPNLALAALIGTFVVRDEG
jgi:lipopolysaccharide export system permease protein